MSISASDFHFERNKFRLVFNHTTWSECYFLDNFQYFFGTFPKTFFGQFPIPFWNISKNLFGTFPILFWINFQKLFGTFPILFWKVSKIISDHFQRYLQIIISLDYYFLEYFQRYLQRLSKSQIIRSQQIRPHSTYTTQPINTLYYSKLLNHFSIFIN